MSKPAIAAQQATLESDRGFVSAVLDTIETLVIVLDPDALIVRFNRACEVLSGYPASEMIGRTPSVLLPADEAPSTMEAFKDLRDGHYPNTYENHWVTRQGELRRIAWSSSAMTDAAGKVTYVIGTGIDITDRHRAEVALRESEETFRTLAESMPQMVWRTSPDGRNLYVNQRWTDYSGLSRAQSRDCGWSESIHPEDSPRMTELWHRATLANQPYEAECRLRRADGVYQWWLIRAVPILDAAGQVTQWFGTSTDIDDLRRTQAELHLNKIELAQSLRHQQALSRRLVSAREAEQQHLSTEMHDRIGQNLAALSINLDIIERLAAPDASDKLATRLSDSRSLLMATIAAVRDLITDVRPPTLDDYGLLPGLRSLALTVQARCGVAITVTGDESEPRLAQPVEAGLFRIAQEALNNVCKHAHATCAELTLRRAAGGARLTIEDDGVGFDQAGLDRAGQRSRWGVLLMQERAEAIGGRLSVDSVLARGTRVVVELT
ncbi:MAG TPA: PAS domain S-box protein [Solimonas sp.]|nr:PAS domain S-box protein [Solimonas sp.]